MNDWLATVLVGIAVAAGVAGVVLPVIPGLWLIWGAALAYGFLVGFDAWAWLALVALTALAVFGTWLVYYLPAKKTGEVGLPRWGQLVVAGCAIAGFFMVPIVGAFLGIAGGTLVVVLLTQRDVRDALGSAWSVTVEMLKAAAAQLAVALAMAMIWGLWAFAVLA